MIYSDFKKPTYLCFMYSGAWRDEKRGNPRWGHVIKVWQTYSRFKCPLPLFKLLDSDCCSSAKITL